MKKATITRTAKNEYRVETDLFLSDCTYATAVMVLDGSTLRQPKGLSVGYRFTITLGASGLSKVQALAIGESTVIGNAGLVSQ